MKDRDCENCVHAHPFGGENDNRCDAWECEFIDRQKAIEAYKAMREAEKCDDCIYVEGSQWCEKCDGELKHWSKGE